LWPEDGTCPLQEGPPALSTSSSPCLVCRRYAQLVANAAAHQVDECWIAKHPVLLVGEKRRANPLAACLLCVHVCTYRIGTLLLPFPFSFRTSSLEPAKLFQVQQFSAASQWTLMPLLLLLFRAGHLFQFVPRAGWALLKKIGPSRARAVKEGRSGYDMKVVQGAMGAK
jgi:hypothetical protein